MGHFNLKLSHNADLVRIAGMECKDGDGQKLRRKNFIPRKRVMLLNRTDMVLACIGNFKNCHIYY